MCGICGAVILQDGTDRESFEASVRTMVKMMNHRGPDSSGVWESEDTVLGACRLAIIGLDSASNQPLVSPDSSCAIVFNGEIYNYLELREELTALGHRFASRGDTEVIVHAYEEWGLDCVHRFNGMFAIALYDPSQRRLLLARDRFGVKPLFYSLSESRFLFASEPRAILGTGLVSSEIDERTLIDYLRFGITDADEGSFFREIRQLPPGHLATLQERQFRVLRWYNLPRPIRDAIGSETGDPTDRFRSLFESSVALRMRSDVPIGVLLSGGLDSSSILAACIKHSPPSSTNAYCATFPGSSLDESTYARAVTEALHVPLHLEDAGSFDSDAVRSCIRDQHEPMISPSIVAQWLVMRAVNRSGIRVLLSGQGSDEYLAGYDYFDAYFFLDAILGLRFSQSLRHLLHDRNRRRIGRILVTTILLLSPSSIKRRLWRRPWLSDTAHPPDECAYFRELSRARTLRSGIIFHLLRRLPELLRYEDRNSMAFSIETRQPFLDYRLVEMVLSGSYRHLVGNGARKLVLRNVMQDTLPRLILNRTDKIGFQTPDEWLDSPEFRSHFSRMVNNAPAQLRRLVDFDMVKRKSRRLRNRMARNDLWRLYNTLAWFEIMAPGEHARMSNQRGTARDSNAS